jgi:hypothetical protein
MLKTSDRNTPFAIPEPMPEPPVDPVAVADTFEFSTTIRSTSEVAFTIPPPAPSAAPPPDPDILTTDDSIRILRTIDRAMNNKNIVSEPLHTNRPKCVRNLFRDQKSVDQFAWKREISCIASPEERQHNRPERDHGVSPRLVCVR